MDRYSPNIQRQLNQYLQGNLGSRTPGGDYGDPSSGGFGMQSGLLGGAYENLSIGMPNTGRSGEGARNFRQNLASGGQHNDDVHLDMYGSGIQMEGVPGVMSNEGGQSDIQELIREETVKAQHCTDTLSVGKSMNTIIILDSSNHMNRTQFAHAKETIECFLQGLETNSMEYSLEENVALVTFGPESTVLQHLTNDYQKIRLVLENLECGGRSSLTYAFLLIYAVMERCYQTHVPEHQFPRILLISNGQIPGINQDELQYLQAVLIEKLQIKVFFVPLGETNEAFSRVIQAVNGEMILAGNIEFFSRSHIHHNIASVIRGQSSGGNITRENIRITSDAQFQARQINDTDIDAILKLLRGESPSAQGGVFLAFGGENDDVQLFGQHGHNQQFGGQRGVNQQFGGQSGNLDHLGRQSGLSHQFGGQRGVNQQFSGQSDMLDEFGGQSGFNHMFDGQRGVNHQFGGQSGLNHQFGGQSGLNDMFDGERGVNHQFGGQRSVIQQFGGQSGVTRQFDVQSDLNHQLGRQSGEVQHYGEQRSDVQVLQSDMQHLSVEGQFNTPPVTHQQTFPPTEGEEGLNGGPSAVSSRTTTQTTSSSQLQQPIQPDPSRQSPITIAALRQQEQQQQQQDNLPTRSPNSNTPLVPTEQQWNTQVTTSSNTRQTSASEAIYTKNTQNVIYSRIHQKKQGPEPPANQNDMTENIPQEGEGPNNPNENQQQAPFHLFGMNAPTDQAKEEEVTQEKIKELLDKFAEEPKIDNLPIMPRPGLRVTTGPDWMWKQNGVEIGDGGTVVERSNADEKEGVDYEGWVRVKWDNDVEEDYRYGVDYEFDIQPLEVGMDGVKWPSGRARITKDNEWLDSDDDYLESLQKEFSNIMAKENLRRDTDEQRRNVGMDNISTSTMESSTVTNTYMASTTTMTTATSVSTATSGSMVTSGLTAASGSTATNGSTTTSVSTATSGSMVTSGLTAASGSTATNGSTTTSGSMTTSGSTATSGSMVTSGLTAASGSTATNGSTTTSGSTATNMSAAATEREVCYIWQYLDEDGEWKTYHLNIQKKVESTYLRRERSVVINTENGSERLIFGVMEQRNVNKNTVRPIRRIAADLETLQELQEMLAS